MLQLIFELKLPFEGLSATFKASFTRFRHFTGLLQGNFTTKDLYLEFLNSHIVNMMVIKYVTGFAKTDRIVITAEIQFNV